MGYDHGAIILKLACDLANYIIDDKERDDYLKHCIENDLNRHDFLHNASLEGAHVYAKAQALLFHLEQNEQKIAEGDLK